MLQRRPQVGGWGVGRMGEGSRASLRHQERKGARSPTAICPTSWNRVPLPAPAPQCPENWAYPHLTDRSAAQRGRRAWSRPNSKDPSPGVSCVHGEDSGSWGLTSSRSVSSVSSEQNKTSSRAEVPSPPILQLPWTHTRGLQSPPRARWGTHLLREAAKSLAHFR